MAQILIAEDEINLLETIKLNLELESHSVIASTDGKAALNQLKTKSFDLAILDVMLPEIDGFTVCENIRTLGIITPVLFLTAKNDPGSRIKGLKLGANDYLGKPFELEELLLRIDNLLKRNNNFSNSSINKPVLINKREIDFDNYTISYSGKVDNLSKKELELLQLLYNAKNRVVSRDEILEKVWKGETIPTPRTIDNFILQFRKLIEDDPKNPKHFLSIRGVGYKLELVQSF
jgi:two-component system alkaline phosphatase synthesis response regulator PhoP